MSKKTIFDIEREYIEQEFKERTKNLNEKDYELFANLRDYSLKDINATEQRYNSFLSERRKIRWKIYKKRETPFEQSIKYLSCAIFLLCLFFSALDCAYVYNFSLFVKHIIKSISYSSFAAFIVISLNFLRVKYLNKVKKDFTLTLKNRQFLKSYLLTFIISLPIIPFILGFGNSQIGSFYERDGYTEKYYVMYSKDSENSDFRKVYKLPAEIHCVKDAIPGFNYYYELNRLHFSNGGYASFNESDQNELRPENEVYVVDNKGYEYYITLTKEKVKNERR